MVDDDVTLGEVGRRLSRVENGQADILRKIDGLKFVTIEVFQAEKDRVDTHIEALEHAVESVRQGINRWVAALGAVAASAVAALIALHR